MQSFDQTIIYALLLTIAALVLLGVGLVIVYIKSVQKYNELRDKKENKDANTDPQMILANAQNKAQQILQDASRRAEEIVNKAQVFTSGQENKVAAEIEKASQMYASSYQESLKALENKAVTMMQTIPNEVKDVLLREITNIRTTIQAQIQKAEADAKQIVVDAYKRAEDEVVNYKKQRLKQVDDSIIVILQDIAHKVLSKEISKEEHEKLVMKALEEAKRSGAFGVTAQMQVAGGELGEQESEEQAAQEAGIPEVVQGDNDTKADVGDKGNEVPTPVSKSADNKSASSVPTASSLPEGYQFSAMPNQASGMETSSSNSTNENQNNSS